MLCARFRPLRGVDPKRLPPCGSTRRQGYRRRSATAVPERSEDEHCAPVPFPGTTIRTVGNRRDCIVAAAHRPHLAVTGHATVPARRPLTAAIRASRRIRLARHPPVRRAGTAPDARSAGPPTPAGPTSPRGHPRGDRRRALTGPCGCRRKPAGDGHACARARATRASGRRRSLRHLQPRRPGVRRCRAYRTRRRRTPGRLGDHVTADRLGLQFSACAWTWAPSWPWRPRGPPPDAPDGSRPGRRCRRPRG